MELLSTIPLSSYIIATNSKDIRPWKGWADDHWHFSRVDQIPATEWRTDLYGVGVLLEVSRFFVVLCALVFFVFFGFAEEVWKSYSHVVEPVRRGIAWSRKACPRSKLPCASSAPFTEKGSPIRPEAIRHKLPFIHDLMTSFSPNMSLYNFGVDSSPTTLAEKQEAYLSTESMTDAVSLPCTLSPHYQNLPHGPTPPPPALTRLASTQIDVRSSAESWTFDRPSSDNIV
jgi:pheromone a factor receptor